MKKSLLIIALLSVFCGFSQAQSKEKVSSYGEKITPNDAIEVSKLMVLLKSQDSLHTKVVGTVSSVCQKKGCWLKMDAGNGETIMVRFYDYGFFVPKDCAGKKIVLEGSAYKTETSVDELRHYAEDAGKSKEEISKITKAEKQIAFEATGALLYND